MKIFSFEDSNRLAEAILQSQNRVLHLVELMQSDGLTESRSFDLGEELMAEAHKLERLVIVEGLAGQDFNTMQKNFRSLLRPVGSVVKSLAGTTLADRLDVLRIEGIELLNDLYDDVKDVESGVENSYLASSTSKVRDQFARKFADFATLIKGTMALADLFSDDPASVGGYTSLREIVASLESDGLLSVPLKDAFVAYQESVDTHSLNGADREEAGNDKWFEQGDALQWTVDKGGAKTNIPKSKKRGFFSRLFGKKESIEDMGPILGEAPSLKSQVNYKMSPLENKFRQTLQKAIIEKSPGFARMVNVKELIDQMMNKSYDHLSAIFGRFDDLISSDVDDEFLAQTVMKPLSVSGALKSVWNSFGSGSMGGPHGRRQ